MFHMLKPEPVRLQSLRSGGQTGVDRAVLDVALASGLKVEGWCPKGRRAEDGPLARPYHLEETPSSDYAQRTSGTCAIRMARWFCCAARCIPARCSQSSWPASKPSAAAGRSGTPPRLRHGPAVDRALGSSAPEHSGAARKPVFGRLRSGAYFSGEAVRPAFLELSPLPSI